jgi:cell division transport system permease protein
MGVWSHFFRSWRSQTTVQVATLGVLVGTFAIMTLCFTIHHNLYSLLTRWGNEVQISVYLKDSVTPAQQETVQKALTKSELFEKVEYLSKDGAAALFSKKIGSLSPTLLTDSSFVNPLPASFEGHLRAGISDTSGYKMLVKFAKEVTGIAGVEEVSYGQGWVENYAAAINVFSTASYALIAILLAGGLFVIGNSIRSSVAQRKDEIALLELFGATRWTIQWPYVFEGLVMGLLAAITSMAVSFILFKWAQKVWVDELQFWSQQISFEFIGFGQILLVLFISLIVGGLGSFICVRKINTGWAASENESW